MSTNRILLMHITDISGHRQAALAIKNALKSLSPDTVVFNINAFNYTNPISEKIINNMYLGIIKKVPGIWEYLYDNPRIKTCISDIENFIYYFNCEKLKPLLNEFRPNVVACTQAFPCGMVAAYKKRYHYKIPLIGVLTDHAPHAYWIHPQVDYYVVGSLDVKTQIINKGAVDNKIKVYGIPIDPKFKETNDKNLIAQKININLNLPVILIMGGGHGLGPIKKIILTLDNMDLKFQIVVISGTNQGLYKWLSNKKELFKKKIIILGYIDHTDQIMDIATLIITKAGGLTISEALTKGLPIIVVEPIPGQETCNTDFLLKHNAAIKIKDEYELDIVIRELLGNPLMINTLEDNAKAISKPNAAIDTAKLLLELCST